MNHLVFFIASFEILIHISICKLFPYHTYVRNDVYFFGNEEIIQPDRVRPMAPSHPEEKTPLTTLIILTLLQIQH